LPTPIAWYAHQLPGWFHKLSTAAVLLVELLGPLLMLGPAGLRYTACLAFIGLMILIEITGNYAFFNLLGIALSLLLLDDDLLRPVLGHFQTDPIRGGGATAPRECLFALVALILLFVSCDVVAKLFRWSLAWPRPLSRCLEFLAPFHLVNSYGLFAIMTTERPEILVEGSEDGVNWRTYEFKWKPGLVHRPPRFVAPHQPRLDWQMWLAAIGYCESNPWFVLFLMRLLEGSKPVLQLIKTDPFAHKSPRYLRASVYDYRFSDLRERRKDAVWWRAERRGTYCPMVESPDSKASLLDERNG
jgi:hypothetical protein